MRIWIFAIAALLVLPAVGAAAVIAVPPVPEQLVEGHTVFTVIELAANRTSAREEFAAAVAVLVREVEREVDATRFPGVLWFNDQYLTPPTNNVDRNVNVRHPCTGAVLAVDSLYGFDPRDEFNGVLAAPTYVESYLITDPNDYQWIVDKWDGADGFIWTVAINNNQAGYSTRDDGESNCAPREDMRRGVYIDPLGTRVASPIGGCEVPGPDLNDDPGPSGDDCRYRYYDPGRHDADPTDSYDEGMGYPCENCPNLQYNAVLYMFLADLNDVGVLKDHTDGSADRMADVSGCHAEYGGYTGSTPRSWPCPADDDNREGNSHAYNPELPWPIQSYDGRFNHGGSGDCDGDGVVDGPPGGDLYYGGDYDCHATRDVSIYYDIATLPVLRTFRVLDVEGSTAPFHCHDHQAVCDAQELADPNRAAQYPGDYQRTAEDWDDSPTGQ